MVHTGLPILVSRDGTIFKVQSDYLRYLLVVRGLSVNSINAYAKTLRSHIEMMGCQEMSWIETSEETLRSWRNWFVQGKSEQKAKTYINRELLIIYGFFIWAQSMKYIQPIVGPFSSNDTSPYPIPVRIINWNRDGSAGRVSYPLLYRTLKSSDMRNATPSEIDLLYVALSNESNPYLKERNTLMARWAEAAGARRMEVVNLHITQLPTLEKCKEALGNDNELWMKLHITKGSKEREISVNSRLLVDTWSYVEGSRAGLLAGKRFKNAALPLEIFLSLKTGKKLSETALSNIFSGKQKEAGISNASFHHLRSIYATDEVERIFRMHEQNGASPRDFSSIELELKEKMGHQSTRTTMKYVRFNQKRKLEEKRQERRKEFSLEDELKEAKRKLLISEAENKILKSGK